MGCCVPKLGGSADVLTPVINVHNVYNSSRFTCLYALCSVYPCSSHSALLSTPTPNHIALKLVFPSPPLPPPPPPPPPSTPSHPHRFLCLCYPVILPCASAPSHPHLFLCLCCPAILLPTPPHPVLLHLPIPTSSCVSVLPYYFPHLHTLCFCTFPSPPLLVSLLFCHITSHTSTPCASAPSHPHLFLCLCCSAILLPTPPHPVLLHLPIPTSSCVSVVLPYYFLHLHTLYLDLHLSTPPPLLVSAVLPYYFPHLHTLYLDLHLSTPPPPPSCVCCPAILLPTPPHPVLRPTPFHPPPPSCVCCPAILLPTPPHPVLRPTPFHPHLPSLSNLRAQQFSTHK